MKKSEPSTKYEVSNLATQMGDDEARQTPGSKTADISLVGTPIAITARKTATPGPSPTEQDVTQVYVEPIPDRGGIAKNLLKLGKERLAAEEKERLENERLAAEENERLVNGKRAAGGLLLRLENERLAAEEKLRLENERLAAERERLTRERRMMKSEDSIGHARRRQEQEIARTLYEQNMIAQRDAEIAQQVKTKLDANRNTGLMAAALTNATKKKEQTNSLVKNMFSGIQKTQAEEALLTQQALSYNRQNMALEDKISHLLRFTHSEEKRLSLLKTTNHLLASTHHATLLSKEKALRQQLQAESSELLLQKEFELETKLQLRQIESETRRQEHEAQVRKLQSERQIEAELFNKKNEEKENLISKISEQRKEDEAEIARV